MRVTPLQRLGLWLPPLVLMGLIFAASAQPSLNSGLGAIDLIGRKIIHFAEYAVLCLLWWRALRTRLSPRAALAAAVLLSSGYAATDELHQSFVSGRNGTPLDWALDTAGVLAAAAAIRARLREPTA